GQAAERARLGGTGQLGRLDVGLYGSASFGVVPEVLSHFKAANPEVDVTLFYAQTPQQIAALRQGRVLAVFERMLPFEGDLEVELVAREPLLLAVNDRHVLAQQEEVSIAALRGETFVTGSMASAVATVVRLCRSHGFEPQFAGQASDVVMATLLVGVSHYVTLVPASMANVQIPGVRYVRLAPLMADAHMDLHCFYLKDEQSPLLQSMLRVVRAFRARSRTRVPG
ncbi:MAG: LysR family transcriptional regulator, partial [Burkholderiales bacterium PBB5]